jgi:hypothetical protein
LIKTQHFFLFAFACFCGALLYGILRPEPPQEIFLHSDKVAHVLAFFAVSFTGRFAGLSWRGWVYWPFWLGLAILLEYMQGALWATRVFSLDDAYANAAGVFTALAVWLLIRPLLRRQAAVIND